MADLSVNYVNIGQGDCTLILSPDGKTRIMIDYGSHHGALGRDCVTYKQTRDAAANDVKQLQRLKPRNRPLTYDKDLRDATKALSKAEKAYKTQKKSDNDATATEVETAFSTFLGTKKKIDHVILTHHDVDHYNKVPLLKLKDVSFGKLYYSGPVVKYIVLRSNYPSPDLVDEYISLTINGITQGNQTMIESDGDVTVTCQITKKTIYTKAAAGAVPQCTVDILASKVHSNSADKAKGLSASGFHYGAEDINGRSIVTMLTYGTDKILIMGDATVATESYLVATYGAALKADTLRVGHHGSDSSSAQTFIDQVKPTFALISCSIYNSYGLPTQDITNRYINYFATKTLTVDKHDITYYKPYDEINTDGDTTRPLWQTWALADTQIDYSGS